MQKTLSIEHGKAEWGFVRELQDEHDDAVEEEQRGRARVQRLRPVFQTTPGTRITVYILGLCFTDDGRLLYITIVSMANAVSLESLICIYRDCYDVVSYDELLIRSPLFYLYHRLRL
jgi:hypothetical protein